MILGPEGHTINDQGTLRIQNLFKGGFKGRGDWGDNFGNFYVYSEKKTLHLVLYNIHVNLELPQQLQAQPT